MTNKQKTTKLSKKLFSKMPSGAPDYYRCGKCGAVFSPKKKDDFNEHVAAHKKA